MPSPFTIRNAALTDAEALVEIYRPYVESSAISFELVAPTIADFAGRIETALAKWAWLVAEVDGQPIGYAYGSPHRAREAYAYSVETSAYVQASQHRSGVARALYNELFASLAERGYVNAYAGVTLPNEASLGFHQSMGFEPIGVFPNVGFKFDTWHSVAWLYRTIS